MSAFAAAIDALFADRNLALDGVYRSDGADPGLPVRVILRRPDRIVEYGDTRILTETVSIDIRTSDVAAPRAGDSIDVDGTIYIIQGEPIGEAERLVWTINARPQ
ncbi:MAG: hypothetical protein U0S49_15190 [Rhodospirillales bacterium]|nr:hypothetical protein [Rhodospirillales bacterium]